MHLALAGPGPELESLKRLAGGLGIGGHVHFLGYRKDVPALIQASAATLLCSEQEGLPRSVMESMCQAVPVIGSNIRGMTDLLADGRGLLVPVGDRAGLATRWRGFSITRPKPALSASRGRAAMSAYDIGNIVRLHEKLYEKRPLHTEHEGGGGLRRVTRCQPTGRARLLPSRKAPGFHQGSRLGGSLSLPRHGHCL